MADLKIQGEVVVDASQAENALDRVGSKAESMAAEVGQSAGQAGRAVDGIGDKADAGAQKFTRAEARMRDAIRKSTLELQQFGKTASEKLEFKLADKGLDASKFQPYLAELRKVEAAHQAASGTLDGMGMSAKATAAALRGVPAQFTDIVTALQGGQRPLTVLMQQGGQLKDMFGGVGAAARALGGYVLGLINPFTLAAAAVGAIALAYNQGSKDQDAFVKALAMSGNAAGVTAGQLAGMAESMDRTAGTQSKAAAGLAIMAEQGRVAASDLERFTAIAIAFESATGTAIGKTADAFKDLAKSPLEATLKLNESMNYITSSVYEQIRALEQQGRTTEAARVAQEAYANGMDTASKRINDNLGVLQRMWKMIASDAKEAWDMMLGIDRQETTASQIKSLQSQLDSRIARGPINDMPSMQTAWEKGNDALRKQIGLLQEQERMLRRGAEADAQRAKNTQAKAEWDEKETQFLDRKAQMQRELTRAENDGRELIAQGLIKENDLTVRLSAIREKYAEKNTEGMKAQRAAAKLLAEDMAALAKMAGLSPDFYKEWDKLNDMFKRGKLDVDGLTKAQAELLKKQPVIAAETKAQADAQKQVNASIDAYRSALQAVAKEEAARVDGIAKSNADLREQIATMGLTNQQIRQRTIELNRATIAEKEQQLARLQSGFTNTREQAALEEEIRLLKERNGLLSDQGVKEAAIAAQREIADEARKTADSINQSLTDALLRGFESGKGFASNFRDTLKNMFKSLVLRPVISFIVQPIGNAINAVIGNILGTGQGGGLLGNLGNLADWGSKLRSAWDWASGLFGSSYAGYGGIAGSFALSTPGSMSAIGATGYGGSAIGAGYGSFAGGSGSFGAANVGWASSGMAAAGVLALPFIVGAIAEMNANNNQRMIGAATSGKGITPGVVAGSTTFDMATGALPDREALLRELRSMGAPDSALEGQNDRALMNMMLSPRRRPDPEHHGETYISWGETADMYRSRPDFYRGEGYVNPAELGINIDHYLGRFYDDLNTLRGVDPALIEQSRRLAQSVVAPLNAMAVVLGEGASKFEATVGLAFDPDKEWDAALRIMRGGEQVGGFDRQEFSSYGDAVRGIAKEALDAFNTFDLPDWAGKQVKDAQGQLDALTGENIGEQAAAIYQQAAAAIAQTFTAIQNLLDYMPLFAGSTQDVVHALAEAGGGMDAFMQRLGAYTEAFYTVSERQAMGMAQLRGEFDKLDISMPASRRAFRELVEGLDLTTEAGRTLFTQLQSLAPAFAGLVPQLFAGASELSNTIVAGMLGTFDGPSVGAAMAQQVQDGIYGAIAGQFAGQITDIIIAGVIDPVIQAAITGSSISAAVSAASIAEMVAQANAVAAAAAAVLNDPAFREAMASIGRAVASIHVPAVRASASVRGYSSAVSDSGSAADRAASDTARAAEQIRKAWQSIGDTLMDEVNRIRGVMNESAGQGVDYWQAQLAIATAQARAGDQDAAKSLTGISQNLLRAAEQSAGSQLDLQRIRAQVAQDLQDTAGYAYGRAGVLPAPPQPEATTGGNMWAGIGVGGMFTLPPFTAPITPPTMSAPMAWTAPPPVYTAQPGASGRDPELLAEVKALRAAIESNARADNDLQRRGVRVLERMDTLGMPKERVETPA